MRPPFRSERRGLAICCGSTLSPASVFAPDSVVGLLEFDTDQNPGTGFPPLQNIFSPPFVPLVAGVGYVVDLTSELFHPGFVDVVEFPSFILVDTVLITYGPMSFSGQIPLASLGGDDGVVDFTSIIGTFPQPTDATDEVGTSTAVAGDGPSLDIKPGSCPNSFNRNSHGVLPVALVGTAGFDVSLVDLGSLLLVRTDGEGGSVAPNFGPPGPHPTVDDVATPSCANTRSNRKPSVSIGLRCRSTGRSQPNPGVLAQ